MVEVTTYNRLEDRLAKEEVDASYFGDKVKRRLLKEAILMYEANKRQGTHSTLTRAEVALSGRKPYRQKGTGYARAGDFKSPLWRGGGVIFGPKPRDYSYSMPAKAKKEALRSSLFGKLTDGEVFFLKALKLERPSAKEAAASLKKLGIAGSTLLLLAPEERGLVTSFRNLRSVSVVPVEDANAYQILRHKNVVFVEGAFDRMKERLSHGKSV